MREIKKLRSQMGPEFRGGRVQRLVVAAYLLVEVEVYAY